MLSNRIVVVRQQCTHDVELPSSDNSLQFPNEQIHRPSDGHESGVEAPRKDAPLAGEGSQKHDEHLTIYGYLAGNRELTSDKLQAINKILGIRYTDD